jgi:endonuclease G
MASSDSGYSKYFHGREHPLKMPVLNPKQRKDLVKYGKNKFELDYIHYSAIMSKTRRFAYYTAVNIDGTSWKDNPRKGTWKKDDRISKQYQLGRELYTADNSNFQQGHLVKREDPEWGDNTIALEAGRNTFIYTNCVPQHRKLNQEIWEELENNILHKGAIDMKLKISVFTGPVLSENDGVFVTRVDDQEVKIPNLFWKIVTWMKTDGKMYAVGFVQSQEKFLIDDGIIKKLLIPSKIRLMELSDEDIFEHLKFKDGNTYQVRIEEIENFTGLKFDWPDVMKPYNKLEPTRITGRKRDTETRFQVPKQGTGLRRSRIDLDGMILG